MTTKLFITGTTGYIGGDALALITEKHPEWEICCLVRNSDKGAKVAARYAYIRLVYGDLDSVDLIEEEASKATIVYHFANCDHEPSAHAIARGLARNNSGSPCFWIHTSGTLILGHETIANNSFGQKLSKVFNDWDGIQELTSMPDEAPHRNVDKIVLSASAKHANIRTAIVCPPTIYGQGRGPDNQRSKQVYNASEIFLKFQRAFKIDKAENIWHQIHVYDLSKLYLLLGEAAAVGGSPATWNDQGYYLVEDGEFVWGEILQEIATVAYKKGLLPSDQVESVTAEELVAITGMPRGHVGVGTNSRGVSFRARKLLEWQPQEKSLRQEIPSVVESEAKRIGLVKGHAQKLEEQSV